MKTLRFAVALCVFLGANGLFAGSATWKAHPPGNNWNKAVDWRPRTVPNGPSDTATFGASDVADVSVTSQAEVDGIVFTSGASAFTITADPGFLDLTGVGITNDSGVTQDFVTDQYFTSIAFHNQTTAGTQTVFTVDNLSTIVFLDQATAGSGTFIIKGNTGFMDGASVLIFYDNASAGSGIFMNGGGTGYNAEGGGTVFLGQSTAANGTFTNTAGTGFDSSGSVTSFRGTSTAAQSVIVNEGGVVNNGEGGGFTQFSGNATAAGATIVCDGGQVAGAFPGAVSFLETASAASAILIANSGVDYGGNLFFEDTSDGGESRIEVFGNATLNLTFYDSSDLTIGSLEGDGTVLLDVHNLTVGANNLSTTFSGVIQDTGGVTKVGTGTLTLSGASTYSGGTTVTEGFLKIANRVGSATGSGAIQVSGGTLGGGGIISGAVTVGSGSGPGAFLAPGTGATTLTLQSSLTFKGDGTYTWRFRTTSPKADKVIANGVTIESGAQFDAVPRGNARLPLGTVLVVMSNTAATAISGTFGNLPDGSVLTVGSNKFQADYEGGDGNDLTLTVVP